MCQSCLSNLQSSFLSKFWHLLNTLIFSWCRAKDCRLGNHRCFSRGWASLLQAHPRGERGERDGDRQTGSIEPGDGNRWNGVHEMSLSNLTHTRYVFQIDVERTCFTRDLYRISVVNIYLCQYVKKTCVHTYASMYKPEHAYLQKYENKCK